MNWRVNEQMVTITIRHPECECECECVVRVRETKVVEMEEVVSSLLLCFLGVVKEVLPQLTFTTTVPRLLASETGAPSPLSHPVPSRPLPSPPAPRPHAIFSDKALYLNCLLVPLP